MIDLRAIVAKQRADEARAEDIAAWRDLDADWTGLYLIDVSDVFEIVPYQPEWRPYEPCKEEGDEG